VRPIPQISRTEEARPSGTTRGAMPATSWLRETSAIKSAKLQHTTHGRLGRGMVRVPSPPSSPSAQRLHQVGYVRVLTIYRTCTCTCPSLAPDAQRLLYRAWLDSPGSSSRVPRACTGPPAVPPFHRASSRVLALLALLALPIPSLVPSPSRFIKPRSPRTPPCTSPLPAALIWTIIVLALPFWGHVFFFPAFVLFTSHPPFFS
jgi:hypothetical protein